MFEWYEHDPKQESNRNPKNPKMKRGSVPLDKQKKGKWRKGLNLMTSQRQLNPFEYNRKDVC